MLGGVLGRVRLPVIGAALLVAAGAALWAVAPPPPPNPGARVELPLPPAPPPGVMPGERPQGTAESLVPAPDPALVESSPDGPLPIIGPGGRQPWQVYARPFDRADKHPRIALVVMGLGLDAEATRRAIDGLPPAVTLAFDPYGRALKTEIESARRIGHEVVLGLPMEPIDYPRQDPGPYTLLTSLAPEQNLERLRWLMSRASGYVGFAGIMGSRFIATEPRLAPILDALKHRGLLILDSSASPESLIPALSKPRGLPWEAADRLIDSEASRDGIDKALAGLETVARRDGVAVGAGGLYPVTLERVGHWASDLAARGLVLAPASAVAGLQRVPEKAK